MAPTSDERREVAARLRFCARDINGTCDFSMYLGHWVNADEEQEGNPFTVQADRKSAERTLEKLADLIDPTCHPVPSDDGGFSCSECGAHLGAVLPAIGAVLPQHCPRCGARVTNGGEG